MVLGPLQRPFFADSGGSTCWNGVECDGCESKGESVVIDLLQYTITFVLRRMMD